MNYGRQYQAELEPDQVERLDAAHDYAYERYEWYRKRGHNIDDAYRYALAWGRNKTEQVQRRKGHGTGCE